MLDLLWIDLNDPKQGRLSSTGHTQHCLTRHDTARCEDLEGCLTSRGCSDRQPRLVYQSPPRVLRYSRRTAGCVNTASTCQHASRIFCGRRVRCICSSINQPTTKHSNQYRHKIPISCLSCQSSIFGTSAQEVYHKPCAYALRQLSQSCMHL